MGQQEPFRMRKLNDREGSALVEFSCRAGRLTEVYSVALGWEAGVAGTKGKPPPPGLRQLCRDRRGPVRVGHDARVPGHGEAAEGMIEDRGAESDVEHRAGTRHPVLIIIPQLGKFPTCLHLLHFRDTRATTLHELVVVVKYQRCAVGPVR